MRNKTVISEYTEAEFLLFVKTLCDFSARTEKQTDALVDEFCRLSEHPEGSDVIFYPPDEREDTPEGIVKEVKAWRAANGKPGFKEG
jgi:hypothetical protein